MSNKAWTGDFDEQICRHGYASAMPQGPLLGFRPPRIIVTRELQWVLQAAFSTPEAKPGLQPSVALTLARQLDLASRIAGRLSQQALIVALGPDATRTLVLHRLAVRAGNRVLLRALQRVAACAADLGIPLVSLKFAALAQLAAIQEGDRDARDVDLLVSDSDADRLWSTLSERRDFEPIGKKRSGGTDLPGLQGADRELVELNRRIKGLRMPGTEREPVTLEALRAQGLLRVSAEPNVWIPEPALLAAHATVHGLIQHGNVVGYPGMRLLADVADLGMLTPIDTKLAQSFVEPRISPNLMAATFELCRALREGLNPATLPQDSEASVIFGHLVAASCDPEYQRSLPVQRMLQLHAERRLLGSALYHLRRPVTEADGSNSPAVAQATRVLHLAREGLSACWSWLRTGRQTTRQI